MGETEGNLRLAVWPRQNLMLRWACKVVDDRVSYNGRFGQTESIGARECSRARGSAAHSCNFASPCLLHHSGNARAILPTLPLDRALC